MTDVKWKKFGEYAKIADMVLACPLNTKPKKVMGFFDRDTFQPFLKAEHVELCKKLGIPFDESRVQKEEKEDEEEEQEEQQEEQEENQENEEESEAQAEKQPEPEKQAEPEENVTKGKAKKSAAPSPSASSDDVVTIIQNSMKTCQAAMLVSISSLLEEKNNKIEELQTQLSAVETKLKKALAAVKALTE